jgi:RHS repeat-associated protein
LFADRGFTSHEFLKYFNLYNMNGRMYDPLVGRFISPDPFVQAPSNTQSMNRYTYCMNNPLVYVDYNGYTWFTKLGQWLGKSGQTIAMIGVTIGVSAAVVASCGTLAPLAVAVIAGAASGAVGGALGAAFQGGNVWHGALSGGASGAVSGLIGGTLGKWAVKGLQKIGIYGLTKYANSPVIKSALASGISSAAAGGVTAFATELAMGGDLNDAINAGVNGAIVGGTIGALAGARAGYREAKRLEIDPWTGKQMVNENSDSKVMDAANNVKDWLGENYKVIENKSGDNIFMSEDGTRKIRFDITNSHGDQPHFHLEIFKNGKWRDALDTHRFYPKP